MVAVKIKPDAEVPAKMAGPKTVDVTDSTGRVITLKRPGVLAQYDLVEALGDSARNETYMGMVMPLIFIVAIDGEAIAAPDTKAEIKALIKRLDEAGVAAVMTGVGENFAVDDRGDAVKKSGE